jgi:hypothetical protein
MKTNLVQNSASAISLSHICQNRIGISRVFRSGRLLSLIALVALGCLSSAAAPRAGGCGEPYKAGAAPLMPFLNQQSEGESFQPVTIVGLWHVIYTAGGAKFNESFKMWHSDGIEFENAFLPPSGGNICYGVWKDIGRGTVKLHHVGLMFGGTDGALSNTFTVDEINTVGPNGLTYQGTFDFKVYDLNANLLQEVKGTTAATRVVVP